MAKTGTVLVFGASGQLGSELLGGKTPDGLTLVGLSHADADITDAAAVDSIVNAHRPAVIVNAAAYTAVDRAESEPDLAFAVNADGPAYLAAAAKAVDAPLIHVSTDYVFAGTAKVPYGEDDHTAPVNAYGQSKAAGERAVREATPAHVILRSAWMYGRHGSNFVRTMIDHAAERDEVRVVADQRGSPTATSDVVATILAIAFRLSAGGTDYGIFHFTNSGETTWHGLAAKVFDELGRRGLKVPRLAAIATSEYPTPARRPHYSVLDCSRIGRVYGIVPRPWEVALQEELAAILDEAPAT